ncbi:Peptide-N(4)-(N-acetyl-beta-glucosaminyl)asparagine amidase [Fasciola hepatica]|uniref:Peptide-N(4)-(N-acetyl-beta-glucosaminyl)asparagine amidase n=1 Tax=Fasciola hepatica TaxID=6192 RepID=A0A4E0RIN5_FASHE|nr:Peptide-N(4)-(N-acetyl-beta-glucosaminyl)asparagine amidase [Fasciola hepatica]
MNTVQSIQVLQTVEEFGSLLEQCASENSLLLLDFYADWCGPCRAVAPQFYKLAEEFHPRRVVCAKVNADHARELCMREFVSALPTFKLYRNRECVNTVVGARMEQLRTVLNRQAMDPSVVQIIQTDQPENGRNAAKILLRIFRDVTQNRLGSTNQCLKLSDPDLQTCLLNVPGAMECLFAAGYQEAEDELVLPENVDIDRIRIMMEYLSGFCEKQSHKDIPAATAAPSQTARTDGSDGGGGAQLDNAVSSLDITQTISWIQLLNRVVEPVRTISTYLDPQARERARSIIPTQDLIDAAALKSGCTVDAVSPRAFLRELVRWYKEEFFRWADSFECSRCKTKMQFAGTANPTAEEIVGRPGSVETYRCPADSSHPIYRFPRYNNVNTLLCTRLGRCGEWANCLTFLLSVCARPVKECASNASVLPWFPACRYISDWTDHVWCEVWLEDEHNPGHFRWVHCDPGGETDQPLLYEDGWGKKLTYVFAYTVPPFTACDGRNADEISRLVDIQDVTWRYTRKFQEVIGRRHRALEAPLAAHLAMRHLAVCAAWNNALSSSFISSCGSQHPFSLAQIARETTSFLNPPAAPSERLPGRQTGSLEWRRARGELGSEEPTWRGSNVVLRPTPNELKQGSFLLRYNAALDIYQRPRSADNPPSAELTSRRLSGPVDCTALVNEAKRTGLKGWHTLTTRWRNISRKVEPDWHMVYLAREEGTAAEYDGRIEWVLDLNGTGYAVGKVSLFACMVCHSADSRAQFVLCSSPTEKGAASTDKANREETNKTGDIDSASAVAVSGESDTEPGEACVRLTPGSNTLFQSTDFVGAKSLHLDVRLWTETQGTTPSDVAWQQAQLFRQKDTDYVLWPLEWNVELVREETRTARE